MRRVTAGDDAAVAAIERELVAVHRCLDVLGVDRLLWLHGAFVERGFRLASSLDSARRGWLG